LKKEEVEKIGEKVNERFVEEKKRKKMKIG
jgi:hypothetical protein